MRSPLLIATFILFLAGCGSPDKVPGRLIQPGKMQVIVRDMMRADQFLADFVLNKDTSLNKLAESSRMYQQVLALHDIDKEQFRESFLYYQTHPALMKALMDSISKMPTVMPATTEPKLVDSLAKIPQ